MQVRVVSESYLQRNVRRREQRAMSPAPCAVASLPPRAAAEVLHRKTALGRERGAHSAIANGADAALLACAAAVPGAPASATHPLKLLAYYWHPIRHARGSSRRGSTPPCLFRRCLAWLAFERATRRCRGRPSFGPTFAVGSYHLGIGSPYRCMGERRFQRCPGRLDAKAGWHGWRLAAHQRQESRGMGKD